MIPAWIRTTVTAFRQLSRSTRGAVALIGALSLTTIVGMGAFAVEATRGYAADTENQRIADSAALAGALAYNVNSNVTEMRATAKAVVAAQGLPASAATVALVTDAATSKQLVEVTVTTAVPLALGRVFSSAVSYDVTAVGAATVQTTTTAAGPCVAAISSTPTYGITMNGGTALNATGCVVGTAAGVSVSGSAEIMASQVNAGKAVDRTGGARITTAPTANNYVANKPNAAIDWMKDNADLRALLCKVNKLNGSTDADYADGNTGCTTPLVTPPAASGQNWNLNYSPAANVAPFRTSNNTYVVPSGSLPASIGSLTVAGGITATFQGPLTLTVASISMGGGTTLHVGSGNVVVNGNIDLQGGAYVDFAVGVGNSVTIGSATGTAAGSSISIGGGSILCFTAACAPPSAAAGTFSVVGSVTSNGGTTIIFPKAATHVIGGSLNLSGNSTLGSGSYIIGGNFTNNTGGTMAGVDVTFALGGTFTLSGGTSLDLAAPGASSSYGVPGILFATKSSAASRIGGGSNNRYSGLVYAPNSALSIGGGASMSASSACLMMVVATLDLSGSGSTATGSCAALQGSTTVASVSLFR